MHIDLLSPESFAAGHPFEQYQWLRENAPVYRHPEPAGPGFWVITRHADVLSISRDPTRFSNGPTIAIEDPDPQSPMAGAAGRMMLMMDPPAHTAYRKLISREFLPAPATALVPRLQVLATQIIDEVIEQGECDFVADVAGEMPSYVIAELMGLPLADGRELYRLTEVLHTAPEAQPPGAAEQAAGSMFEYATRVYEDKRAHPGDDLASKLVQAEVDGERLSLLDFQMFFMLLIDAGGDTTRNLLGGGLLALLERPQVFERLRAQPSLIPAAREELLRWVSPVVYMRRTAKEPLTLRDQRIEPGDKVVLYYAAANRDADVFPAADTLDIERDNRRHVAFGQGTHVCLGQHIARVEIDAVLAAVCERLHHIELAGPVQWLPSNFISGPSRMPIRFRPGSRQ